MKSPTRSVPPPRPRRKKASAARIVQTRSLSADAVLPALSNRIASTEKLIIVGASTGGTEAIKEFLIKLPPDCPGIAHHPAHAGSLHQIVRPAPRQPVQDFGEGSASMATASCPAMPTSRRDIPICWSSAAAPITSANYPRDRRSIATVPRWMCCSAPPRTMPGKMRSA